MENADDANERINARTVRVDFVKFVDVDAEGAETDVNPSLGYTVYNDRLHEFGNRSFQLSDSYTLAYDVLHHVKREHPEFTPYIDEAGGLLIDGMWTPINADGELPS